jgi:hypothetical protein
MDDDKRGDPAHDGRFPDITQALAAIGSDYPGWHAWPAVFGGLVYARRRRASPSLVVRASSTGGLRLAIEDAERKRGLR